MEIFKSNCIPRPERFSQIVIRDYYSDITDKNMCAAALLYFFQNHTDKIIEQQVEFWSDENYVPTRKELQKRAALSYLNKALNGLFSKETIIKAIKVLKEKGFIEIVKHSLVCDEKTTLGQGINGYILNTDVVKNAILNWQNNKDILNKKPTEGLVGFPTTNLVGFPTSTLSESRPVPCRNSDINKNYSSIIIINNKEEIIKENLENFGSSILVEEIVEVVEEIIKPLEISKEKKVAQKKENIVSLQKTSSEAIIGYYNEVFSKRSLIVDSNISIVLKALNQGYSEDNLRTIIDNVFSQNQNNLEYQWGNSISQIFSCGRDGKIDRNFQYVKKNNNNGTDKKNSELRIGQLHGHDFTKNEFDQAERVARNIEEKRKRHEEVIAKLYS